MYAMYIQHNMYGKAFEKQHNITQSPTSLSSIFIIYIDYNIDSVDRPLFNS